jgi:hypothetical protein
VRRPRLAAANLTVVGALLVLGAVAAAGCRFTPAPAGPTDGGDAEDLAPGDPADPLPTGAISFFEHDACPPGWSSYAAARGRAVVPMGGDPDGPPEAVGNPLSDGEQRGHYHNGGAIPLALPEVSFVGFSGGSNAVGQAGDVAFSLATSSERAAPPYVELWACKKVTRGVTPGSKPLPSGMVAYFEAACPGGWARNEKIDGRYLVGLPTGATPGLTFGGPPLQRGEERMHSHVVAGFATTKPKGIALLSGCCGAGFAKNGTHGFAGGSANASSSLPYVQLVGCVWP